MRDNRFSGLLLFAVYIAAMLLPGLLLATCLWTLWQVAALLVRVG